jgi:hypothetical protein
VQTSDLADRLSGRRAGFLYLWEDLGRDQLQLIDVIEVEHLKVQRDRARLGERRDLVHELGWRARQSVLAQFGQVAADGRRAAGELRRG